jgi:hypothetical protein
MKRVLEIIAVAVFCVVGSVCVLAVVWVAPLPPDRAVAEEFSPDGRHVAKFSWRPAGVIGIVTRDNPWVYVTIVESSSGRVVARHETWGDVPADACDRLGSLVPWRAGASIHCDE